MAGPAYPGEVAPPAYPGEAVPPSYPADEAGPAQPGEAVLPSYPADEAGPAQPGEVAPPTYPGEAAPPAYPGEAAPPAYPADEAAPAQPGDFAPPTYPGEVAPPTYPGEAAPPAYPGEAVPPAYPADEAAPAYPGEVAPPSYPADEAAPAYPGDAVSSAPRVQDQGRGEASEVFVGDVPPAYPGEIPAPAQPGDAVSPVRPGADAAPAYPADVRTVLRDEVPEAVSGVPAPRVGGGAVPVASHDDLALEQGRRMVKAVQRGIDGAALSHLLVTLPIGLISLGVVTGLSALVSSVLAVVVPVVWLLSGPLVFHRRVESAIARRLFGMRRPTPEEAGRLDLVWEQVTRRAGVDRETYELWIQERTELNATAAAGHIVAVTRHAMDRLPNSRLAAVLAHELGHHVGGHTWAAMLADWYALPARAAGRAVVLLVLVLFRTRHWAGIACGGCLTLMIVQFLFVFTFVQGYWWFVLPVATAPLLIAWLHRRAEFRADAYAVGLGFGQALETVLVEEAARGTAAVPGGPTAAAPSLPPGTPPIPHQQYPHQKYPGQQYQGQPYPGHQYPGAPAPVPPGPEAEQAAAGRGIAARAAHTNTEARLRNVRLVMGRQVRRSAP
ncbi:M48 family metalloprotease [Streptomyces sp. NPDC015130]|uniref:M48 family metalloprotease n=1 Tax=Streptomyces sp. NPDC015130 TaxID=3364940 RepID=UPI00370044FE